MILNILLFVLGFVIIIKGGDWFVNSSIVIAKKTKIPPVVIGATIVSLATTLPEILVSVIAAAQGSFELAVGNAVGSMISNLALILGIVLSFLTIFNEKKALNAKITFLLGITLFLFICSLDMAISWWEALILLCIYGLFIKYSLKETRQSLEVVTSQQQLHHEQSMKKTVLFFLLGTISIAVGALLLVEYGTVIATLLGISEYIVGVAMIALGTSLPELVTAIQSIKNKNGSLALGNIIGANMLNASLLIGLSGFVAGGNGLPLTIKTIAISLPFLLFATLLVALPLLLKGKTFRFQGIMLIVCYVCYITFVILL